MAHGTSKTCHACDRLDICEVTRGSGHGVSPLHTSTVPRDRLNLCPRSTPRFFLCGVCTVSVSLCAYARYTILDRTCGRYAPSTYLLPTRYVILSCARRALQLYTLYIPLRV